MKLPNLIDIHPPRLLRMDGNRRILLRKECCN